ncbi:MAG TPA: helix-turn-helix domain-containing protein [Gemmataceae bacterium]|nr:helix-turn-helix domain-containing protein [Gemmataceae bacterium]
MLRVQLERAKQPLAETDLTVAKIAVNCSFAELKRLSEDFRAGVGLTPLAYRRQPRMEGAT